MYLIDDMLIFDIGKKTMFLNLISGYYEKFFTP